MKDRGARYAPGDDRLANFKSPVAGLTPLQTWAVYFKKHIDAIMSLVGALSRGEKVPPPPGDDSFGNFRDARNYIDLGVALLAEEIGFSIYSQGEPAPNPVDTVVPEDGLKVGNVTYPASVKPKKKRRPATHIQHAGPRIGPERIWLEEMVPFFLKHPSNHYTWEQIRRSRPKSEWRSENTLRAILKEQESHGMVEVGKHGKKHVYRLTSEGIEHYSKLAKENLVDPSLSTLAADEIASQEQDVEPVDIPFVVDDFATEEGDEPEPDEISFEGPEAEEEIDDNGRLTVEKLRDWAQERKEFTTLEVAEHFGTTIRTSRRRIYDLIKKGTVVLAANADKGGRVAHVFRFNKPETGATKEHPKVKEENGGNGKSSAPVPGTGSQNVTGSKDLRSLLQEAHGQIKFLGRAGTGHSVFVVNKTGLRFFVPSTPSTADSVTTLRAEMIQKGVELS